MENNNKHKVCPVERAGGLDNRIRRWLQNPVKILKPYIDIGMTALDVGCGPGFFTLDMAEMVSATGTVIAADLQEGMLQILKNKIKDTSLDGRIEFHQCQSDKIGVTKKVDFVLAFYMVHETPDKVAFFKEIKAILKPGGKVLVVEPIFHVNKKNFEIMVNDIIQLGYSVIDRPKVFFSKAVVLKNKI